MPRAARHFLVTAGPTREAIDPVRFLTNRSSGAMGFAVARAAAEAGHHVTLIAGPVHQPTPDGVTRLDVESAEDMYRCVEKVLKDARPPVNIAILSAAVADYRPAAVSPLKIKKQAATLTLELERTRDILGSMRQPLGFQGVLIGFAAETNDLLAEARRKLETKSCDLIVANDVSRPGIGFDSPDNEVTLVSPGGEARRLPTRPKLDIARELVALAAALEPQPMPPGGAGG